MAIVKVIKDGPCTINVYDDAIVHTQEGQQEILDNLSDLITGILIRKWAEDTEKDGSDESA